MQTQYNDVKPGKLKDMAVKKGITGQGDANKESLVSLLVDADVAEEMSEKGTLAANWATDAQAFFQHAILDKDMLDDSRTIAAAMGADVVVGRKLLGEDVYVQALQAALRNTTPFKAQWDASNAARMATHLLMEGWCPGQKGP